MHREPTSTACLITSFEQVALSRALVDSVDVVFIYAPFSIDKDCQSINCQRVVVVPYCGLDRSGLLWTCKSVVRGVLSRWRLYRKLHTYRLYHFTFSVDVLLALLLKRHPHANLVLSTSSNINSTACGFHFRSSGDVKFALKVILWKLVAPTVDILDVDGERYIGLHPDRFRGVFRVDPIFSVDCTNNSPKKNIEKIAILGYTLELDIHYFGRSAVERLIAEALEAGDVEFKFHPGTTGEEYFLNSSSVSKFTAKEVIRRACSFTGPYEALAPSLKKVYTLGSKGIRHFQAHSLCQVTIFCSKRSRNFPLIKHALAAEHFRAEVVYCDNFR